MDNQQDLFGMATPKARAITLAWEGADEQWKERALSLLRTIAERQPFLASDDLWAEGLEQPREPRALGPCMLLAQREGWLQPTQRHRMSGKRTCHKRPVRVWRSMVWEGE